MMMVDIFISSTISSTISSHQPSLAKRARAELLKSTGKERREKKQFENRYLFD